MYSTHFHLEPPDDFIPLTQNLGGATVWSFGKYSVESVRSSLQEQGLVRDRVEALLARVVPTPPEFSKGTLTVAPKLEWLVSLSSSERANLYAHLAMFPENVPQTQPHVFRKDGFDEFLQNSGLADDTKNRFRSLLYPHGNFLMFSDARAMFDSIRADSEKKLFLKVLGRVRTQMVRLRIREGQDVRALVEYWAHPTRSKDVGAILQSLSRRPGGGFIDVVHLLPAFARKLLYTYAVPSSEPAEKWLNCHWTTFNFLNREPDSRYLDPAVVARTLREDYVSVPEGHRFGDIVVLGRNGEVIHSAIYIADGLVFTKNGNSFLKPWTLMKLSDVQLFYSFPGAALETKFLRKKLGPPSS